jgi:hypothetical protein
MGEFPFTKLVGRSVGRHLAIIIVMFVSDKRANACQSLLLPHTV